MRTTHERGGTPTPSIEGVRARIAYGLLLILAGTIGLTFVAAARAWVGPSEIELIAVPIVLAEIGLLAAVTGFYYPRRTCQQHPRR